MSGHTKGPWQITEDSFSKEITSSDGSIIGSTSCESWAPENDLDWNLIAAAPDLLEALEQLFRIGDVYRSAIEHDAYGEYGSKMDLEQWTDLAKAAIAKARGEK